MTALLGLDTKLADLNNRLSKGILDFINWQSDIIKNADSFWNWLGKTVEPVLTFASKTRQETLSTEVKENIETNRIEGYTNKGGELIKPKVEKPKLEERVIEVVQLKRSESGLEAMQKAIELGGDESYFNTPIASRMGDTITNNSTSNTVNNQGAKNITVNQNINITGVNDPQRIKRELNPAPVVYNQIQSVM